MTIAATIAHALCTRPGRLGIVLAVALVVSGCDLLGHSGEEDPGDVPAGVVVANGGNFSDQNGYLTGIDPATGQTVASADLGAFAQSLALHEDRAYVAMNTFTTGRIDIVDLTSFRRVGQITGVPAPRVLAFVGDGKAYVTNLSAFGAAGPEPGTVSVLDLEAATVVGAPIEVGLYPEGVVVAAGKAFVANSGISGDGTTLSVIDTATDEVTGTVALGCDGPKELFVDAGAQVVAVCQGKTVFDEEYTEIVEQTNGQVVFVDPSTETVTARLRFDTRLASGNGSQGAYYAPEARELYVLSSGTERVYRVDAAARRLDAALIVPAAADLTGLTAVAYDPPSERLYVGRFAKGVGGAPDYTSAGAVVVLDRFAEQVDRYTVGPAPSHIALESARP